MTTTTTGDGSSKCGCSLHQAAPAAGLIAEWRAAFLHPKNQAGIAHHHREYVAGCFRCDLSQSESAHPQPEE